MQEALLKPPNWVVEAATFGGSSSVAFKYKINVIKQPETTVEKPS